MKPLITIRKTMWSLTWTFIWTIFLSFLIFPVFYLIYRIVAVRSYYTEVYEDRVIDYGGVFNKSKNEHSITKVLGVNKTQSFFGNMFDYGNISVNLVGSRGLLYNGIGDVNKVEQFFKSRIINANELKQAIIE